MVRHNFQHAWAQALERLRGHVFLTPLRQVQRIPDFILHTGWERPERPESIAKPHHRLDGRSAHSVEYAISSMADLHDAFVVSPDRQSAVRLVPNGQFTRPEANGVASGR